MSGNQNKKKPFSEITDEHIAKESIQKEMLQFVSKPITCCVSIIDIVESTKITAHIIDSKIGTYYSIFLNSVSDIVKEHEGVVVKNIGDSLLYYFYSQDNFVEKSFNCNLDIIKKREQINKKLEKESLPKVRYRISSDYGKVLIAKSLISSANDIFGSTVNMCAKINHVGDPNKFFVGNDLYLHAKNMDQFHFDEIMHKDLSILKNSYPIYYVDKK